MIQTKGLLLIGLIAILLFIPRSNGYICNKHPHAISYSTPPKRNNNDKYLIDVEGSDGITYVPGTTYIISLKLNTEPPNNPKSRFENFVLVVEHTSSTNNNQETSSESDIGSLRLIDPTLTRFSSECPNTIKETNTLLKSEVQVQWTAPPEGNGCVLLTASVVESKDTWYSQDGALTRTICETSLENEDLQPELVDNCQACLEAKFEMIFEGMWSRNTHPKDFPDDSFKVAFSEIVGASHRSDYSFWNYEQLASDGIKMLATTGNTSILKAEFKDHSKDIRTIIMARELKHPNTNGKTYTAFRVDKHHHRVSVVAKMFPSPDWIVGVANFELCTSDGQWVESKTFNLYPWDAGVMDGISYMSPPEPSDPQQPIARLNSTYPNTTESPFYDDTGETTQQPFARLQFVRQKLYPKQCPVEDEEVEEEEAVGSSDNNEEQQNVIPEGNYINDNENNYGLTHGNLEARNQIIEQPAVLMEESVRPIRKCVVTKWSPWGPCNTTGPCKSGYQFKFREIKTHPENGGKKCPKKLRKKRKCRSRCYKNTNNESKTTSWMGADQTDADRLVVDCVMGDWDGYSACGATCGQSVKIRSRRILIHPSGTGKACGPRTQTAPCEIPITCD